MATTTSTIHNPDGSTSSFTYTDTFSWRAVYDVPFGRRYHYRPGWNVIGVQEDYARSSFTGASEESCTAPSGGSCVVGGGGSSCRANFQNTSGIPLELLVFSPPTGGRWKLAAPAHQASQRTSGTCGLVGRALDDTCDPLWKGPFPGQGENSPVTAQFTVRPKLVLRTARAPKPKPIPVSASKSWSCKSSNGTATDTGNIHWHGTVKPLDCSGAAWKSAAARALEHRASIAKKPKVGPELPSWIKVDCPENETGHRGAKRDANGDILVPAVTIYHCHLKLSFSWFKGVVQCETPVLVDFAISVYIDRQTHLPVWTIDWSGQVVGTGRNVGNSLKAAYDRFIESLSHISGV
jgi:hypothetical protein